jgi:hypothetical protein
MKLASLSLALVTFALLAACAPQNKTTIDRRVVDGLPRVTATETLTGEAKILAVDYHNRGVALSGQNGETLIFTVPVWAQNFDRIRAGDKVKVRYDTNVEVIVRKASDFTISYEAAAVEAAPVGSMPEVVAVRKGTIATTVANIDYEKRTVRLVDAAGKTITIPVKPELKAFENVKVGDAVNFDYTEIARLEVVR